MPPLVYTPSVGLINTVSLFEWSAINPSKGVYNWAPITAVLNQLPAGGSAHIDITAGVYYRADLPSLGAQLFTSCGGWTIPVPWDPIFLQEWDEFVTAYGAQFGADPRISAHGVTGVANVHFPSSGLVPDGQTCDDTAAWLAIGYSPENMEAAFKDSLDNALRAIPTGNIVFAPQPLQWPVWQGESATVQRTAFIAYVGSLYGTLITWESDSAGATGVDAMIANAAKTYGGHLIEQSAQACGTQAMQCLQAAENAVLGTNIELTYEFYLSDVQYLTVP